MARLGKDCVKFNLCLNFHMGGPVDRRWTSGVALRDAVIGPHPPGVQTIFVYILIAHSLRDTCSCV